MVMRSPTRGLCLGGKSHYLMGGGRRVHRDLAFDQINAFKEYGYCKVI